MIKHNKQGRFCLGMGIVDRGDSPEGKMIELFYYLHSQNAIEIKDVKKLIGITITEVALSRCLMV